MQTLLGRATLPAKLTGARDMKRILAVMVISVLFTGCASVQVDPYEKYLPWKPIAIAKVSREIYLVEPSSKKQVAPGVYKVWTKDTTDLNTMELTVVDCNSEQTAISQMVTIDNQGRAKTPFKIDSKFSKPIFNTVGYSIIEYICK